MTIDRSLSINQIRGKVAPPSRFRSSLIERYETALHTPIEELSPGEIAMFVRQKGELDVILPIALELLSEQPLLDAGLYPGDMLAAVLLLPVDFWRDHPDDWFEVNAILSQVDGAMGRITELRPAFEMASPESMDKRFTDP